MPRWRGRRGSPRASSTRATSLSRPLPTAHLGDFSERSGGAPRGPAAAALGGRARRAAVALELLAASEVWLRAVRRRDRQRHRGAAARPGDRPGHPRELPARHARPRRGGAGPRDGVPRARGGGDRARGRARAAADRRRRAARAGQARARPRAARRRLAHLRRCTIRRQGWRTRSSLFSARPLEAAVRSGPPSSASRRSRASRPGPSWCPCAGRRRRGADAGAAGRAEAADALRGRRCAATRTPSCRSSTRARGCCTASTCAARAAGATPARISAPRSPRSSAGAGAVGRASPRRAARDRGDRAAARAEHDRPAHPPGAADRPLRQRRRDQPRGRRQAVPQPAHRRVPPPQGVHEARHRVPGELARSLPDQAPPAQVAA